MHSTPSFEKCAIQKEGIIQMLLPTGGHFFIAGDNIANYKFQSLSLFALFNLDSIPSKEMTTEMTEGRCYIILYGTLENFSGISQIPPFLSLCFLHPLSLGFL